MNGQIAIRARGEDQPQPTELLLSQSARIGDPLRINTDRRYLARALRHGFRELLRARRDASETVESASIRFTLDHCELCGDSGIVTMTDGP